MNAKMLAAVLVAAVVVAFEWFPEDDGAESPRRAGVVEAADMPRPARIGGGGAADAVAARKAARPPTADRRVDPSAPIVAPPALQPVNLNGRWYGEIRGGPIDFLQFSFDFRTIGSSLSGRANFPIGEGNISNGRVDGNRLSFTTVHQLPATGQMLLSRFEGEATDREIVLDVDSGEGGRSRLTVMRIGS